MQYRRLGRTGLQVSILSLGSGGPNQFGQMRHVARRDILGLVRRALDLGINYFDTASGYGESEALLGEALQGVPRDSYRVASKFFPRRGSTFLDVSEARRLVERSLRRLRVDALDIAYFHRVRPQHYTQTMERLMPLLQDLRAAGKIRHIGISESSKRDPQHRMLEHALRDDLFDAVMVAYALADSRAEQVILPRAQAQDVGVVGMVAARNLVGRTAGERIALFLAALRSLVASPTSPGTLPIRLVDALGTLRPGRLRGKPMIARKGGKGELQLPSAGYTFALSHPAVATVLTGTNNPAHLLQNVAAALAPALTPEEILELRELLQRRPRSSPGGQSG